MSQSDEIDGQRASPPAATALKQPVPASETADSDADAEAEAVDADESGRSSAKECDPFDDETRESDTEGQMRLQAFESFQGDTGTATTGSPNPPPTSENLSAEDSPTMTAEWDATERTAPVDPTRHDGGLTTDVGDGGAVGDAAPSTTDSRTERLQATQRRASTSSREETLREGLGEVQRIVECLELPEHVEVTAAELFREVSDASLLRGRSLEAAAGACIYAAVRITDQPATINDVVQYSRVDQAAIRNAFTAYNQELDLALPPQRPQRHVPKILNHDALVVTDQLEVRRTATSILDDVQGVHLSGKAAHTVAAGAIALAADWLGLDLTKTAIATAAGTSRQTVHTRMKHLQNVSSRSHI